MTQHDTGDKTILDAYRKHWKTLVLVPMLVGAMAVAGSFLMTPIYTASTQIMPPQQQSAGSALLGSLSGLTAQLGGIGSIAGLKNPADQWIGMLGSRTILNELVKRFKLQEVYGAEMPGLAREQLQQNTRISAGKDGLIDIDVDDPVPARAQQLANGYVEELAKLTSRLALTEAKQRRIFFEDQLERTKNKLATAETRLKQSAVSDSLMRISPGTALTEVAQLKSLVTVQEVKIASMRGTYRSEAPEVRQAEIELAALRRQLANAEKPAGPSKDKASDDYVGTYREFKYQEILFELLAKQYEIARTDEAREGSSIQVIDPAEVPERKSRPKRLAVGAFAWLATQSLLMLGLALWALRRAHTSKPS